MTKLSPVEQLTQLLQQQGPDSDDVRAFFQLHKEQACATCLVLACSQQVVMQPVSTSFSSKSSLLNVFNFRLLLLLSCRLPKQPLAPSSCMVAIPNTALQVVPALQRLDQV